MILLLSPAGTGGWRATEAALADSLARLGFAREVRRVETGRYRRLLRFWPLGALLVGWASRRELRRALAGLSPEAVIAVNASAALFLPWRRLRRAGIRVAIRADCSAEAIWTGPAHAPRRRLERRALRRADAVLSMGPRSSESLRPLATRIVEVPFGIEPAPDPAADATREPQPAAVIAYAGDPRQKGLDLICAAWSQLGAHRAGAVLAITGIEAERGRRHLRGRRTPEPEGIEWAGILPRDRFLARLRTAAAFVSASRWEDHGLAQLEALAAGVPLVTTPSRGAYEAEPLARELAPDLVCAPEPAALAEAIARALALDETRRAAYAARAARLLEPYRAAQADERLAGALSSLGLSAPAPAAAQTPPRSAG